MLPVIKAISNRLTALALLALLFAPLPRAASQDQGDLESLHHKSTEIDDSIKARRSEYNAYHEQEGTTVDSLQRLELELNQTVQSATVLKAELDTLDHQIHQADRAARELAARIHETETHIQQRLLAIYKMNRIGRVQVLVSANSAFELLRRKNAIEQILEHDEGLLKKHLGDKKELTALSASLNQKREKKIDLEIALQREIDLVSSKRAERQSLLEEIRSKKELVLAAIVSLNTAAQELDETIARLYQEAAKLAEVRGKPFVSHKGLLVLPVNGRVVSFFGPYKNQRFNITNFRSGIEIGAERGEPVRAVLGGRVLYSGWFKNYGNMIILDHGDHYYTLYAHAEELFKTKGDYVETQEVIATVGDSASMSGTNLYFEVRHHGKPLDPMGWLKTG